MMLLDELVNLLGKTPVVTEIHRVSTCYLPEHVRVFDDPYEAIYLVDNPKASLPLQFIVNTPNTAADSRFPRVRCDHDPFTSELNSILFDKYEKIASLMLCQSQVAGRIMAEASNTDIIVLFLVDGLSYQDVRNWSFTVGNSSLVEPCMVDTPTLTEFAFTNLIGNPPLAMQLFNVGYSRRIGFTYWLRENNELTDKMFLSIGDVRKTGEFSQILATLQSYLENVDYGRTYVQIVRTGLDGFAHEQKRKTPVSALVDEIKVEFDALARLLDNSCKQPSMRFSLYLTSDHGILWRDQFDPQVIGNVPGKTNPRGCSWRELYHQRDKGRRFYVGDKDFYCLGFPKLRRPLHIDEQGVHGGISFQESIVPFIKLTGG